MNHKFFQIIFFAVVFLGLPSFARADVTISEVAWMGTSGSQYEEWIELYNDGSSTSLDGWKIYKAGGSTTLISLSGSISAGQYLLVCRTTPSVPNPLSGSCDVTGSFGGSGLNNTSEHIVLKNSGGTTIDEINATSGWPAGDSSSKDTMQKNGSGWITAAGTPGAANSSSDNGNDENEQDPDDEEETDTTDTEETETSSTVEVAKIYPTRLLKVEAPKIAIAGSPTHFRAQALDYDRSNIFKGHYAWNMGDGTTRDFALGFRETNDGFDYAYEYPGTYSVNIKYYHSFLKDVPAELEQQFTVEVVAATVTISKIYPDGAIEIKNTSGNSIDLSAWQIRDGSGRVFIIPDDTHVAAGKTIVFPTKATKLVASSGVNIYTPTNTLASANVASVTKTTYSETSSSKKKSLVPADESEGQVLGIEDADTSTLDDKDKEKSGSQTLVYVLIFVIILLVAVIAVLFLRKEERTDDGYELIDE